MKTALAHTPKHDFVMPAGEVRRVTLCDTGKPEVFLTGTVPAHTCGDGSTPAPVAPVVQHAVKAKPRAATGDAAIADPAAPGEPAPPKDSVGDGTTFQSLDSRPAAPATP
jgi:hypothetical protein